MLLRIFIGYNVLSYALAYLVYVNADWGINIYNFVEDYADLIPSVLPYYITMIIGVAFGALLFSTAIPRPKHLSIKKPLIAEPKENSKKKGISIKGVIALFVINIVLMYFVLEGNFFIRETYHDELGENGILLFISRIVILISVILMVASKRLSPWFKWMSIFLLITLSLNYSSRASAAYVIAVFFFDYIINRNTGLLRSITYIFSAFIVLLLGAYLRGLDNQGLYYYFVLFNFNDFYELSYFAIFYTFSYSVLVTLGTIGKYMPVINELVIMINPLPGFMVGWHSIRETMIVVRDVPYSTNGMIFTTGFIGTFMFYAILGAILTYLDSVINFFNKKNYYFFSMLILSLGIYYVALHSGWELRSTMRILYYTLGLAILFKWYVKKRTAYRRQISNAISPRQITSH